MRDFRRFPSMHGLLTACDWNARYVCIVFTGFWMHSRCMHVHWAILFISSTKFVSDDGQRPSFGAGRIILGFWWVFTILITASYTANLAAFLTISLAKPPVKNLEELASQTIYKPLIVQETNHHAMFKVIKIDL